MGDEYRFVCGCGSSCGGGVHRLVPVLRSTAKSFPVPLPMKTRSEVTNGESLICSPGASGVLQTVAPDFASSAWSEPFQSGTYNVPS